MKGKETSRLSQKAGDGVERRIVFCFFSLPLTSLCPHGELCISRMAKRAEGSQQCFFFFHMLKAAIIRGQP